MIKDLFSRESPGQSKRGFYLKAREKYVETRGRTHGGTPCVALTRFCHSMEERRGSRAIPQAELIYLVPIPPSIAQSSNPCTNYVLLLHDVLRRDGAEATRVVNEKEWKRPG
ncbi:unnamed protein product [Chondrus crispus]|uniref:Uncharacterized protein n=1 Tax=Chondrus crispus TaxID=2769 RepID=R7Q971_CHOCR|nr:unnamed protein product [Chondrus crispus]CDF34599.1 unnamed protein product [Chondrus crispus]|eukprot:XP_005714418.1 unnamed protein product [Chondrus crispus]